MCLAIPARVEQLLDDASAIVYLDGVRKAISLALVDDVAVGDYVIVHVGFALQKLDVEEAERDASAVCRDAARRRDGAVKYIDEFRNGESGATTCGDHRRRGSEGASLSPDGVLRWPHARHFALWPDRPAATAGQDGSRAWLPGLRAAGRVHRPGDPAGAGA